MSMREKAGFAIGFMIVGAVICFLVLMLLATTASAAPVETLSPAQRTVTISVPSGAWVAVYPVAGHRSSEVSYRCAGGRWRGASDGFYPRCTRVTLSARIWFDFEVIRGAQQDA